MDRICLLACMQTDPVHMSVTPLSVQPGIFIVHLKIYNTLKQQNNHARRQMEGKHEANTVFLKKTDEDKRKTVWKVLPNLQVLQAVQGRVDAPTQMWTPRQMDRIYLLARMQTGPGPSVENAEPIHLSKAQKSAKIRLKVGLRNGKISSELRV